MLIIDTVKHVVILYIFNGIILHSPWNALSRRNWTKN